MGTLPSSSLLNPSFRFRQLPHLGSFRLRDSVVSRRGSRDLCVVCKERLGNWRLGRRREGFRCFSINGNEEGEENGAGPSTKPAEEGEKRVGGDDSSSERTRASVSSRVLRDPCSF